MSENEAKFITTIIVPREVAAKMTKEHWMKIDFIIQDALRLIEPDLAKFRPTAWTRPEQEDD